MTPQELAALIKANKQSEVYKLATEQYQRVLVHSEGIFPEKLIGGRRPHEPEYVLKYRKQIYQPISKETYSSVENSLSKIRRSTDWSIKYDDSEVPARIPNGESLEDYCEGNYPRYTSIKTYGFNASGDLTLLDEYLHELNYIPVVRIKGAYFKTIDEFTLYESRISSMLPRLDEAVREYSDQQANIVNHLFPERWEYGNQNCDGCINDMGLSTGMIKVEVGKGAKKSYEFKPCEKCGGSGSIGGSSPFKKYIVRPASKTIDEQPAPIPPFGYVNKDTGIIDVLDKRIEFHQYKALASLNMQFLMNTPLNQSGLAKEVDKDELNNFVYSVAEDLVAIMDEVYKVICDYRYSFVIQSESDRDKMLPKIAVPEKFDMLSSNYLADEVKAAKDSKLSGVITSALELDYCSKKFYNNPEVRDEMQLVIELDPMVGASEDDKMLRLQNGGITKPEYILSCNIVPFVKRAMIEIEGFAQMEYKKKMELLRKYADEIMRSQTAEIVPTEEEVEAIE
jgi:hypothetical protein